MPTLIERILGSGVASPAFLVTERIQSILLSSSSSVARGDQHHEFVAAEPGHVIIGSAVFAESVSDDSQDLVAGQMPEPVVHLLEAIEIRNHHSERRTSARGAETS